jgi:hypothetical protein
MTLPRRVAPFATSVAVIGEDQVPQDRNGTAAAARRSGYTARSIARRNISTDITVN